MDEEGQREGETGPFEGEDKESGIWSWAMNETLYLCCVERVPRVKALITCRGRMRVFFDSGWICWGFVFRYLSEKEFSG